MGRGGPSRSGSRSGAGRRILIVVLVAVLVGGLVLTGRTLRIATGSPDRTDRDQAQLAYLRTALDHGDDVAMQRLFPEGRFFTDVLTALAAARQERPDVPWLRDQLALLDSAELTAPFGAGLTPEHGTFQAGWTLLLATEIARVSPNRRDVDVALARADALARVLATDPAGVPESYPGGRWPCDAVVAAAAVSRADGLRASPARESALRTWRTSITAHLDPGTGLLAHRVAADGTAEEGPRGSSQAIIQAFWPDIALQLDEEPDLATWRAFVATFVTRQAGLVGVREFPIGRDGSADVDSGPLLLGVSASASAVTLAAAIRNGDTRLADSLDREAELLGAGFTWRGERRYAFGRLPVGDAFLAWARTIEPGVVADPATDPPAPRWPLIMALGLLPSLLAGLGLLVLGRRRPR